MNLNETILKTMCTSRLRNRITIMRLGTSTYSEDGDIIAAWQDVATIWACVEAFSMMSVAGSAENEYIVTYRVTIRYGAAAITQADRIRLADGGILTITAPPVDVAGRHVWIVLEAKRMVEVNG